MRRRDEIKALTFLAGRFPVPALLGQNESSIMLSFVPGVPGQEILEQRPDDVLFAVGRAGRALHELDVSAAYQVADGSVLVHGDFGPQNMLFDGATLQPKAVVDWEFSQVGEAAADLAWAEWIVRIHHPHLLWAIDALFDGYGHRPSWPRRQAESHSFSMCMQLLPGWPRSGPSVIRPIRSCGCCDRRLPRCTW